MYGHVAALILARVREIFSTRVMTVGIRQYLFRFSSNPHHPRCVHAFQTVQTKK